MAEQLGLFIGGVIAAVLKHCRGDIVDILVECARRINAETYAEHREKKDVTQDLQEKLRAVRNS